MLMLEELGLMIVNKKRTCENNEGFVKVVVERLNSGARVNINGKYLRFKVRANKKQRVLKSPSKLSLLVLAKIKAIVLKGIPST